MYIVPVFTPTSTQLIISTTSFFNISEYPPCSPDSDPVTSNRRQLHPPLKMQFTKIIAAVASAAVFTSVASARMTAPEIVSNINIITGMSQSLQAPASSINTLSGPLFLIGQGPFPVGRPLVSSALFTLLNLA